MTRVETLNLPADRLPGETVVALFFQDQRPLDGPAALLDWRLDGQLTRLLLAGEVSGRAGEHLLLQNNGKLGSAWVLLVGGGKWQGLSRETYAALLGHMLKTASGAGFRDVSVCVAPHAEAGAEELDSAFRQIVAQQGRSLTACRLSCATL